MAPGKPASLFEGARYVYIQFEDFKVVDVDLAPDEVVDMVNDIGTVYEQMVERYGSGHKAVLVSGKVAEMLWLHVNAYFTRVTAKYGVEAADAGRPSPSLETSDE